MVLGFITTLIFYKDKDGVTVQDAKASKAAVKQKLGR